MSGHRWIMDSDNFIGAGRKAKQGEPLDYQMRLSAQEMVFLKYARKNHLDYSKLMSAK